MKKCPYCAELIHVDAVKCRYCNEWLDKSKSNSLLDFVSKTKNFIIDEINKKSQSDREHLFIPTEAKPMQIRRAIFYQDRFICDNEVFYYCDVVIIYCKAQVGTVNFITSRDLDFRLLFRNPNKKGPNDNFTGIPISVDGSPSLLGNLNKKEFEQLSLIHNVIANYSFNNRVSFYMEELVRKGFFQYDEYEFYQNGDVKKKGKVVANLLEEFKKDTIYFGMRWGGALQSESNPFEFFITNGQRIRIKLFANLGLKVKIDTYVNHDVFESIIKYLLSNSKYPIF